ncbi:photosynthetic complex assembly protein PuhC [Paracraurococcus lichenis]|uniref:Photosynthetic complex assembly protein PuhC n=1 Tax=Paracraurococcus lichenis TaxID=3064888 RepID=A0ABT9DUI6_9PROT|nr:photosynthetic complex assembly protein PuhC [Paracraurococcus sp. LOR1-02]MDO9707460.1 photosynthetic complex assembly protein PuhC [Paracraurococcus sp. LOR1-02]
MSARAALRSIPRVPLLAGLGLLLFTLFVTDGFGLLGRADASPHGAPLRMRDFRFEDRADGAIVARDAASNAEVEVFDPGTNGFVRGALRAMSRPRRQADTGRDVPFRLAVWRDGRVTLEDPVTSRTVELNAFGETNKDVFLKLLLIEGSK